MTTLYETLGISSSASEAEIKAAWRKLMSQWHPDRNSGRMDEAKRRAQAINHAYTVLSDPGSRRLYDESVRASQGASAQGPKGGSTAADKAFYQEMGALAVSLALQGFNKDVVIGALLGRGCSLDLACVIAKVAVDQVEQQAQQKARTQKAPEPSKQSSRAAPKTPPHRSGNQAAAFASVAIVVGILALATAGPRLTRSENAPPHKTTTSQAEQGTVQDELVTGFDACHHFFPGGSPRVPDLQARQPRSLCYDAFAILHSGRTKTAIFAVERLTAAQLADASDEERTNRFFADARLPSAERATLDDYKGSGFDRGHLASAADMPTPTAMAQSFSLANMVPQAPENNRKTWAQLEGTTQAYVKRAKGPVYVFTGPVYPNSGAQVIGKGRVWVPKQLYKLVYDAGANRAWAHWVENENEAKAGMPISYDELVRRTGIEFLPGLHPQQ